MTDRAKGTFEIQGVSREICEEFSTRRKQVLDSREKYKDYAISEAKKSEYACLDSRKNKTSSSVEEIRQDVEQRLEKYGQKLEQIKETALHEKSDREEYLSREECIKLAVEQVSDKQSAFTQEDVLEYAMRGSMGAYMVEELKAEMRCNASLKILGEDGKYKETYLTTDEIKKAEAGIIQYAEQEKGKSDVTLSREKMNEHLDRITAEGKILTEGQRQTIEMI